MKKIKTVLKVVALSSTAVLTMTSSVFAADAGAVLAPMETIKTILIAIVSLVGVFTIIWNIMHISSALKDRDQSALRSSLLGLIGGVIMAAIGIVIGIFV